MEKIKIVYSSDESTVVSPCPYDTKVPCEGGSLLIDIYVGSPMCKMCRFNKKTIQRKNSVIVHCTRNEEMEPLDVSLWT